MEIEQESLGTARAVTGRTQYQTVITSDGHAIIVDEPEDANGSDTAIAPYGLLMSSLASCTSITLRMYIDRKMWIVDEITVDVEMIKVEGGTLFKRKLNFKGDLNEEQKHRLIQIADACPIHKILVGGIMVDTELA
ncbi:OsmC family protein [Mucilaginibacter sp. KACC 22063]|uniref:OsmC family protein n=1 Tax=Mucilaginibacter sp. KACC 22063 TaxID=3025666 RepID=UPI002365AF4E|nr:OsmC family protein [Mucilaginibacter sp. KACC 22063]WDF53640.1 OsmC family protein [Mucilaginibacter sp. KACC 22063]